MLMTLDCTLISDWCE